MPKTQSAPGKAYRKGLTLLELFEGVPDGDTAETWFVAQRWPTGVTCPHCGSSNAQVGAKHRTMRLRCRGAASGSQPEPEAGVVPVGDLS